VAQDWQTVLQNGISTGIDGYIQIEVAKNTSAAEKIPPAIVAAETSDAAVKGAFGQNNINLSGVGFNKNTLIVTAGLVLAVLAFKAVQ